MNPQNQTEPKSASIRDTLLKGLLKVLGEVGYLLVTLIFVVLTFMPIWLQALLISPILLIVLVEWWNAWQQKG